MNNFLKIPFLATNRVHSTEYFFLKRLYFDLMEDRNVGRKFILEPYSGRMLFSFVLRSE